MATIDISRCVTTACPWPHLETETKENSLDYVTFAPILGGQPTSQMTMFYYIIFKLESI